MSLLYWSLWKQALCMNFLSDGVLFDVRQLRVIYCNLSFAS